MEPAEVESAPRKEAVVEPAPTKKDQQGESNTNDDPPMEMIDAWIAYCDRSKADDKVLSDCLTALRDESGVDDSPKTKTTQGGEERAELISLGKVTSAEEVRVEEDTMKNVVFPGEKARTDVKEAHEELDEVKAPEEAADGKAALEKETTREAPYEERVEAWVE